MMIVLFIIWGILTAICFIVNIHSAFSHGKEEGFKTGVKSFSVGMAVTTFWPLLAPIALIMLVISPFYGIWLMGKEYLAYRSLKKKEKQEAIEKEYKAIREEDHKERAILEKSLAILEEKILLQ